MTDTDKERLCDCHGKAMRWDRDTRYTAGGFWRCRVKHNESQRKTYADLTGVRYNRMLLMARRRKAMHARRQRRNNSSGGE